jgi:signal peptidase I
MEPTITSGQAIEVTEAVGDKYLPHRGDVVLFKSPAGWFDPGTGAFTEVERIIGVPGDHVACAGPGSPVTVNGVALNEPYVYKGDEPSMEPFDVTVPPGRLWVMGDHRDVSVDSRAHERVQSGAGFIPTVIISGLYQAK